MTPELTALCVAALLQMVQFVIMAVPANLEVGPRKTLSPRDDCNLVEEVSLKTARLVRAMNNHFEALILFTIAVVVITYSDQGSAVSALLAWIYVLARILYIPAYAFGWTPWRSLIWFVGFLATAGLLLLAIF